MRNRNERIEKKQARGSFSILLAAFSFSSIHISPSASFPSRWGRLASTPLFVGCSRTSNSNHLSPVCILSDILLNYYRHQNVPQQFSKWRQFMLLPGMPTIPATHGAAGEVPRLTPLGSAACGRLHEFVLAGTSSHGVITRRSYKNACSGCLLGHKTLHV